VNSSNVPTLQMSGKWTCLQVLPKLFGVTLCDARKFHTDWGTLRGSLWASED